MDFHPRLGSAARTYLQKRHQLLIDGKYVDAQSGQRSDIIDPGTEQVIASVADGGVADLDLAVAAARKAFETGPWQKTTPAERTRILFRFAELIEANGDEIGELESINSGKPLAFCRNVDVPGVAEMLRYMAGWTTKMGGQTVNVSLPGEWHAYTLRQPIGVVAQIVPWNFPLNMAVWKIAPALAAGCTIILKPAQQTPLSALRLGELALEAGIPPGVLNIMTGQGSVLGAAMASHMGIDKVAFTGSTEVGKQIAVAAATSNLKRVSLELGGKSPVFVFPDADLDAAAMGVANGIFFHAGQVCAAGSRLYAHKDVFEPLIEKVGARARAIKIGHALDEGSEIGPVISARQLAQVQGYIARGQEEGAELRAGGNRVGNLGYFVEPTILANTRPGMSVHDEEIFGPVLSAMSFDDDTIDALAARANASPYGLSGSIWTRDIGAAHKLARRVQSGTLSINAHTSPDATLPFGGFKQSGWGRERGFEAIELYTEVKSVGVKLD
jgi:phenylacetaldehyde dehydrogenase